MLILLSIYYVNLYKLQEKYHTFKSTLSKYTSLIYLRNKHIYLIKSIVITITLTMMVIKLTSYKDNRVLVRSLESDNGGHQ